MYGAFILAIVSQFALPEDPVATSQNVKSYKREVLGG